MNRKTDKPFFGVEIDKEAKGKNIAALEKSRDERSSYKERWGCIPESILVRDIKERSIDLISRPESSKKGSYTEVEDQKKVELSLKTGFTPQQIRNFRFSLSSASSKPTGDKDKKLWISEFPQNVGRIILDIYCPERGTVYDPFAGHNSRMELTYKTQRNYIGVDVSEKFMSANEEVKKLLLKRNDSAFIKNESSIQLIKGSSAKVPLSNGIADFTITSPPYWDLEYYGPEATQLGNSKTYEEFLSRIKAHVSENFRVLKSDTFCCWFVNDFRKNGVFYPYHSDLIPLFLSVGFTLFNIYIVDLGRTIAQVFLQNILRYKLLPKRHEYCLVFKKGGKAKNKSGVFRKTIYNKIKKGRE